MNRFVLDASVALSWFIDAAIDPFAVRVSQRLLRRERAVVPPFWRLEMANGFVVAERRRTLNRSQIAEAIKKLEILRSQSVEYSDSIIPVQHLLAAARDFGLTAYDAEYLETARLHRLPLATLDRRLKDAATASGIDLLT